MAFKAAFVLLLIALLTVNVDSLFWRRRRRRRTYRYKKVLVRGPRTCLRWVTRTHWVLKKYYGDDLMDDLRQLRYEDQAAYSDYVSRLKAAVEKDVGEKVEDFEKGLDSLLDMDQDAYQQFEEDTAVEKKDLPEEDSAYKELADELRMRLSI